MSPTRTRRRRAGALAAVLAAVLATATATAVLPAAPAGAAPSDRYLLMSGAAVCDRVAREWVITWSVTNPYEVAGTLGNVRVTPPGRPLVGLPNRVLPGQTVTGVQRTLATEYTATLTVDVNWDDGPVSYDRFWPTYIRITCGG